MLKRNKEELICANSQLLRHVKKLCKRQSDKFPIYSVGERT